MELIEVDGLNSQAAGECVQRSMEVGPRQSNRVGHQVEQMAFEPLFGPSGWRPGQLLNDRSQLMVQFHRKPFWRRLQPVQSHRRAFQALLNGTRVSSEGINRRYGFS